MEYIITGAITTNDAESFVDMNLDDIIQVRTLEYNQKLAEFDRWMTINSDLTIVYDQFKALRDELKFLRIKINKLLEMKNAYENQFDDSDLLKIAMLKPVLQHKKTMPTLKSNRSIIKPVPRYAPR